MSQIIVALLAKYNIPVPLNLWALTKLQLKSPSWLKNTPHRCADQVFEDVQVFEDFEDLDLDPFNKWSQDKYPNNER